MHHLLRSLPNRMLLGFTDQHEAISGNATPHRHCASRLVGQDKTPIGMLSLHVSHKGHLPDQPVRGDWVRQVDASVARREMSVLFFGGVRPLPLGNTSASARAAPAVGQDPAVIDAYRRACTNTARLRHQQLQRGWNATLLVCGGEQG